MAQVYMSVFSIRYHEMKSKDDKNEIVIGLMEYIRDVIGISWFVTDHEKNKNINYMKKWSIFPTDCYYFKYKIELKLKNIKSNNVFNNKKSKVIYRKKDYCIDGTAEKYIYW